MTISFSSTPRIRVAFSALLFSLATTVSAQDFAQKPLFVGASVDPNLLFILDDSGSMRWGFMPDGLMGGRNLGNCVQLATYDSDTYCAMNVGARPYLLSPTFNKVYYDPDISYQPPLKADGTRFPDANFNDAPVD